MFYCVDIVYRLIVSRHNDTIDLLLFPYNSFTQTNGTLPIEITQWMMDLKLTVRVVCALICCVISRMHIPYDI